MSLSAGVDWGTIPAWVSGIVTTVAVIISLALGLYNLHSQRQQKRDDEELQARTVVIRQPVPGPAPSANGISYYVSAMNFSDAPIHDVVVGFHVMWGEQSMEWESTYRMVAYLAPHGQSDQEFATPFGHTTARIRYR
jgi:hypothetical protein